MFKADSAQMWKAFILYEHLLFARGLQKLLRKEGVEVVGVAAKTRAALGQIKNARPDLIVTEADKGKSEAEMLLFRLMREADQARVVRVSLEDNSVACYIGRRCLASTVEELVKCAIKSMASEIQHNVRSGWKRSQTSERAASTPRLMRPRQKRRVENEKT